MILICLFLIFDLFLISVTTAAVQKRFAHIDIPDISGYKRSTSGDVDTKVSRRAFTYVMVGGTGIVATHTAKVIVNDFLDTMSMSEDVKALAQLEVELDNIQVGQNVVMKWQGKPTFIRHRTPEEIAEVQGADLSTMKDPMTDQDRVKADKENWLVVLGICTHLGCVPISHAGKFNGYFCPCHGSHYDASGRIRQGPAPLNLEVPPYKFVDDSNMVIG